MEIEKLKGVHPHLCKVVEESLKRIPFKITEGLRTYQRQQQLFKEKKTRTLNSRHLTGHAVDVAALVDGKVSWDFPHYQKIAAVMKEVASEYNIPIVWGGDWKTFVDGPHFELDRKKYP